MIKKILAWSGGIIASLTSIFALGWIFGKRSKQNHSDKKKIDSGVGFANKVEARRKEYDKAVDKIMLKYPKPCVSKLLELAALNEKYYDLTDKVRTDE